MMKNRFSVSRCCCSTCDRPSFYLSTLDHVYDKTPAVVGNTYEPKEVITDPLSYTLVGSTESGGNITHEVEVTNSHLGVTETVYFTLPCSYDDCSIDYIAPSTLWLNGQYWKYGNVASCATCTPNSEPSCTIQDWNVALLQGQTGTYSTPMPMLAGFNTKRVVTGTMRVTHKSTPIYSSASARGEFGFCALNQNTTSAAIAYCDSEASVISNSATAAGDPATIDYKITTEIGPVVAESWASGKCFEYRTITEKKEVPSLGIDTTDVMLRDTASFSHACKFKVTLGGGGNFQHVSMISTTTHV